MTFFLKITLLLLISFNLASCNSDNRLSVLQKCSTLGDESIAYARANYIKLFHYFNADKFQLAYEKVKEFDHVTHRNIINTYDRAVKKIQARDPITQSFLNSCKSLSMFSKNFVDQAYPRAIVHKSTDNPLSDIFFIQINQIVKYDSKIGVYDKLTTSFQEQIANYKTAKKQYSEAFKAELSE